MGIKRIGAHLLANRSRVQSAFPPKVLSAIEQTIRASESSHSGQIRFVVEGALDGAPLFRGQTARERALDIFADLRIWDTEQNNGVLIYLLLADRNVEIVADRGINNKVKASDWEAICRDMEIQFRDGKYERGVALGIEDVTRHLVEHFPKRGKGANELPDEPVVI